MKETILVCVSHPTHAEKLIQHGLCLVHAFHGRGLILNVHPTPYDALDYNEWQTQHLFRTLAEKYALPLFERVSPTSAAADVIVATINEQSVTQVVLGQTAQNRLEAMFGNSMVNQLLKKATGVAIHIMAVNRVDRSGMAFDKGLNAWLSEYDESSYRLCFEKPAHPTTDGVFFKRAATDFEHGYFVTAGKDGRPNVFPVVNGKVSREDWTKKTLSQISFALHEALVGMRSVSFLAER